MPERRQHAEEREVRHDDAAEVPRAHEVDATDAPPARPEVAPERRLGALPARLPRQVAPELPAEARTRDGKRRREAEVGIVLRPRLAVVLQMVGPVGDE